ncbi:putative reverse transcriptase domain-containing protein [Tanacetum coccineum]
MYTPAPRRFHWEIVYPPPGPKWFIDLKTVYRMKRTAYRSRVLVTTYPFRAKEKSPERVKQHINNGKNPKNDGVNPNIAAIITQQLQNIIPQIVTQVTNNVNNINTNGRNGNGKNGNDGNGGNNGGCTYKEFLACKPRDFDGKGGAIVLTRWIEKMESVMDISGCVNNQKFKALLVEEFCPSNKMEKLETEFRNHAMVGANHAAYTDRFHELAKLVPHLVTPESKRIKRYIHGLAPQICGMIRVTQSAIIQSAILMAGTLTDEAVGKGFAAATLTRNENPSSHPKCAKCFAYHPEGGPCRLCYNFQKPGHFVRDCRAPVKQVVPVNAVRMADFSFISTDFVPLLNVKPSILRHDYVIEVANGKKIETDRIIRGCILELGDSLFTIHLIPFGHGSFDVIVGMDWLSKHKAKIVCHEKVVRIPLASGKVLRVQGELTEENPKSVKGKKSDEPKLGDISIVRDFPEVFPKDLSRLPPQRQVEFCID